ncbi:hypothetical protein PR048_008254 [Dryococelus australis]|uniref:Uncharacterized protein n=1 Tax=Dryococelus australis TaxID=614101 RepID=A0ABQ9HWK7_9NEOP|nr:hypothetical protein PR048_008254 [Dryococelus australis]
MRGFEPRAFRTLDRQRANRFRHGRRGGNGEILEKTRRPAASSGTIPKCDNLGVIPPGIELRSPGWKASPSNHVRELCANWSTMCTRRRDRSSEVLAPRRLCPPHRRRRLLIGDSRHGAGLAGVSLHRALASPNGINSTARVIKALACRSDAPRGSREPVANASAIAVSRPPARGHACPPPTKAIRVQSPAGSLQIFACGDSAGRCRWSAGFLGDLLSLHTRLNHSHQLSRPRCYESPKYILTHFTRPPPARAARGPHFEHRCSPTILLCPHCDAQQRLASSARESMNLKVLRTDECEVKQDIPEKTRKLTVSSGTISTCENPGADPSHFYIHVKNAYMVGRWAETNPEATRQSGGAKKTILQCGQGKSHGVSVSMISSWEWPRHGILLKQPSMFVTPLRWQPKHRDDESGGQPYWNIAARMQLGAASKNTTDHEIDLNLKRPGMQTSSSYPYVREMHILSVQPQHGESEEVHHHAGRSYDVSLLTEYPQVNFKISEGQDHGEMAYRRADILEIGAGPELFMLCHSGPPAAILPSNMDFDDHDPVTFDLENSKKIPCRTADSTHCNNGNFCGCVHSIELQLNRSKLKEMLMGERERGREALAAGRSLTLLGAATAGSAAIATAGGAVPVVDDLHSDDEVDGGGGDVGEHDSHVARLLDGGEDARQRAEQQHEARGGRQLARAPVAVVRQRLQALQQGAHTFAFHLLQPKYCKGGKRKERGRKKRNEGGKREEGKREMKEERERKRGTERKKERKTRQLMIISKDVKIHFPTATSAHNNNVTCLLSIGAMLRRLLLPRLPGPLHVSSFCREYNLQPRRHATIPQLLISRINEWTSAFSLARCRGERKEMRAEGTEIPREVNHDTSK